MDTIKGDFNRDGKQEFAWLRNHADDFEENDSLRYFWHVEFSDKSIPRWTETWNIRPLLVYEVDLDQNGVDEFGILDTWNVSVYRSYKILTYHENSWKFLVKPWLTTEASRESGKELAYPTDRKGYIRITFDEIIDLHRCVQDTVVEATFEKTN